MSTEAILALKENYGQYSGVEVYLLVEGTSDKSFIEKLHIKNTMCIPIGPVINAKGYILYENNMYKDIPVDWRFMKDQDAKQTILSLVKNTPSPKVYGLVDKDFDTKKTIQQNHKNIFVTPTHDLETLLLSTDKTIFESPEGITDSFNDALYLAYQIGLVKKYLKTDYRLCSLKVNNYQQVIKTQNLSINLSKLINLLIIERRDHKSLERNEKLQLEGEIQGVINVDEDEVLCRGDLYDIANGHDISNLMKLLCEAQISEFIRENNPDRSNDDKAVEFAIINKYNISKFEKSSLYEDMITNGLIPIAVRFYKLIGIADA